MWYLTSALPNGVLMYGSNGFGQMFSLSNYAQNDLFNEQNKHLISKRSETRLKLLMLANIFMPLLLCLQLLRHIFN